MKPEEVKNLTEGLKHLALFRKSTGINPIDNYGYRELMQVVELRQILPSIEKVSGRKGVDAQAQKEGYKNIELKSSQFVKTPTLDNWQSAMFDMSKTEDINKLYQFEGLGHGLFNTNGDAIPMASYWISKEHIKKIHPLFEKKVNEYKILKENKPGGRLAIYISPKDLLQYLDIKDIIWFRNGGQIERI